MPALIVDREQLREAISAFLFETGASRMLRDGEPAGRAAISFREPFLSISNGDFGRRYEAAATGEWPGEAVFDAGYLAKLRRSLPGKHFALVRVDSGRLYLDDWIGIPCWWRAPRAYFEMPEPDSELVRLLYARLTVNDPELAAKGLLLAANGAEHRQALAVQEALKILAPFGVGCWDLHRAIESAARWTAAKDTKPPAGA